MSSRKILILAVILPTLGATIYSTRYSGKICGGENANAKEYRCPGLYECILESNKPNALGACRFLPNGLRLWALPPKGNEVVVVPPIEDPVVKYEIQTKRAQRLAFAHNKFGFEMLKTLAYVDQTNSQNVIISPTSVGLTFNILYNGASGQTKDQLAGTLQITGFSLTELNESAKILINRLNASTAGVQLNISNSVWVKDGVLLNKDIINLAQSHYGAHISNLDFYKPESFKTINDWVYGNTAGKISNAVPEKINPLTVSYTVNTAYFNGIWKYKFESNKTKMRDFYKQDGSKTPVPSMEMERKNFQYLENDLFQAVKLPYGADKKYSMVILLPKDPGVNNLLSKFNILTWQSWVVGFEENPGTLYLPKFKLDYGKSVMDALKNMGMVTPFDPAKADFSKLSEDGLSKYFYVNDVLHKTYIDVNEEGTEAAAMTAIETGETSAKPPEPMGTPFVMDVNKPFFFAIVNEETQANLFVGIVRGL